MQVSAEELEAALQSILLRGGPFAINSVVDRALVATGWDPANDGNPASHVPGIAEIVESNVDAQRDLALYLWQVEMTFQRCSGKTIDDFRALASAILSHVVKSAQA